MKTLRKGWKALLLALVLVIGSSMDAAAITTVTRTATQSGTLVSGDQTTNFTFTVKKLDDSFGIYKLADMDWNVTTETYNNPAWVTELQDWIDTTAPYSTDPDYATPQALNNVTEEELILFLKAIRADDTLMADLDAYRVDAANISSPNTVGDVTSYTISDVNYGLYAIFATNTGLGKDYQPVLIPINPQQEGPTGNWYLPESFSATLKYENISLVKKINGDDYDLVQKNEDVTFTIKALVPDYPEMTGTNAYLYNLNDNMAIGFTYVDDSMVIEYSTDGSSWSTVPAADYVALYEDVAYVYGIVGGDDFAYGIPDGDTGYCNYYYLKNNGQMTKIARYSDTDASWTIVRNTVNTNNGTSYSGTNEKREATESLINISFDWTALSGLGANYIRLTYHAIVNDNMEIGADTNTNTADLYYVEDSARHVDIATDTVIAWTYAMNLIKKDGQQTDVYVEGAVFSLYRMADTYCNGLTGAEPTGENYTSYHWYSNADGAFTAPTDATVGSLSTLDKYTQISGTYYYLPVDVPADTCDDNSAAHKHIVVYKLFEDDIVSNDEATGIIVKGLDPATYLVIEKTAPAPYNRLSEALQFKIQQIADSVAEANGGSYAGFNDETDTYQGSGIYTIEVLNFQGLQLPSTGGIGTTVFTVIGLVLMMMALLIVVLVSRKAKPADEC